MVSHNLSRRLTSVSSTRKNPAETGLDRSRRSSGSGPPAMEQHVTEYDDAMKNVDATRITKFRLRQLETPQVMPSPSEGDRVKRPSQRLPWGEVSPKPRELCQLTTQGQRQGAQPTGSSDWLETPPMPAIWAKRRERGKCRYCANRSEMNEEDDAESSKALAWMVCPSGVRTETRQVMRSAWRDLDPVWAT